jgi:4-hydroxybenzoate polyprenyltransferase
MTTPDQTVADAVAAHWADRLLPRQARPYARLMRLERPIGWWLLLLPGWWSITLAGPDWRMMALFFVGAIIMRGAGCVWNDITDRDFDAQVARTRSRPIPSGQVSVKQAFAFLGGLLLAGLMILLQFNLLTIALGVASLALIAAYPFMKRFTWWPQAFLGLTFNWGALMGWTAVTGELAAAAIFLYIGGIFWTLAYDTIYAHQDKEDDALAGIKSTALRLADKSPQWLGGFFTLSLAAFTAAGFTADAGIAFFAGIGAAAIHAAWQLKNFNGDDPTACLKLFRANRAFGLFLFAGILADALLKVWNS